MLNFILFLFLTIIQALSLTPKEKVVKYDEIIEKIFKCPQEEDGVKLIHTINEYISVVNSTTEGCKEDINMFDQCNEMRHQGWADFLLYDLNEDKLDELKKKFKWDDKEFKIFQSLMKKAEDTWMDFMEYYYEQTE